MNVVVEPLPNCLATLRIEVDPQKVSTAREQLAREFGQSARIPGYRPGKAPLSVIEKRFKKQIAEELEKKLLGDSTREAIAQNKLRVLQLANIEDVKMGEDNSLSFTATVVTQPEFSLPNYKGLALQQLSTEVADKDIEGALETLRDQAADFVDLDTERGAEMEDFVVVDYTGTIDGKPVHELFPKAGRPLSGNQGFWIKMTEEAFFPGYCAALVGAKPGETRKFTVEVPADFPVEGMPGQKIDYEVTLQSIKTKTLPELNDEFAAGVAEGKTLEEVRGLIRAEIEQQKKRDAQIALRNQVMRSLLSQVECELPASLVRNETQRILSEIVKENQERGVPEETLKENEKELVGMASLNARERLKGTFVLLRIAEQEGIKVTREELFGRIATLAERYQMTFEKMLKELEKRNGVDQIQEEIVTGKTLDFLIANANVSPAPVEASAS